MWEVGVVGFVFYIGVSFDYHGLFSWIAMVLVLTFLAYISCTVLYKVVDGDQSKTERVRLTWHGQRRIKPDLVSQKKIINLEDQVEMQCWWKKKSRNGSRRWKWRDKATRLGQLAHHSKECKGKYLKLVESGLICLTLLNCYTCVFVCCCLREEEFGAQSWSWITTRTSLAIGSFKRHQLKVMVEQSRILPCYTRRPWSKV